MTAILLVAAGGALVAAAFVLAPLVHDEENLQPLRRPRPGTRHLHGVRDLLADGEGTARPQTEARRCPHCGSDVDEGFSYCGECLGPLS